MTSHGSAHIDSDSDNLTANVANAPRSFTAPLYGLVLAGGRGTRLRRDKGSLDYHGMPQVRWAFGLLERHCERVWVSLRTQVDAPDAYRGLPVLFDADSTEGPAAGLLAAFRSAPEAGWLLLAADMPLVGPELLSALVAARRPDAIATAFRHADGTPEPLCAIWEPAAARLLDPLAPNGVSLRRVLEDGKARLINCPAPARLRSVNTPEDDTSIRATLRDSGEGDGS